MRNFSATFASCLLLAGCGQPPPGTDDLGVDGGRADLAAPDLAQRTDAAGGDAAGPVDMATGRDGGGSVGPVITMCPKANQMPLMSGTCEITPGTDAKLITGTILTPGEVLRGGQVLVDAMGKIACVGCDCSANAAGATAYNCPTGVVSPALINPHNHQEFLCVPGPDSGERYEERVDWHSGLFGHNKLKNGGYATTAMMRWTELRHLLGGSTATIAQGAPKGLLRNLDHVDSNGLQEGLMQPSVDYDTFPLNNSSDAPLAMGCMYPSFTTSQSIVNVDSYDTHIGEGISTGSHNEFICLSSGMNGGQDLIQPQTAVIHAISLFANDYAMMANDGASLVWSPRSNIRLYGDTAFVAEAARLGVRIAIGTDWACSGSINMLRELACADDWNRVYMDRYFNDEQLWLMVTRDAAGVLAVDDAIGVLKPGMFADIAIFDGAKKIDHRAVIAAEPQDVVLVMRGGKVLFGDEPLVMATPNTGACDKIDACGTAKRVCLSELGVDLASLTTSNTVNGNAPYPLFSCGAPPTNEPTCLPSRKMAVNGSTVYDGLPKAGDMDGDGVLDGMDNCPRAFNPIRPMDNGKQADFDGDGVGDACDPCPLDKGACNMFDPNDVDGDGIANLIDNCPNDANADQKDGDMDGKGDVCDPCPKDANMGMAGCPATIYDVKSGKFLMGSAVSIKNALVTGVGAAGFFLQVKEGDQGYAGPDNSGVFVNEAAPMVKLGDRVDLSTATVTPNGMQIELAKTMIAVTASNEAPPAPITEKMQGVPLTAADLAMGPRATALNGVIVQLANVSVTDVNPAAGPMDQAPINEFVVDNVLRVNDFLHLVPTPPNGERYATLAGILELRNGNNKIEPRDDTDAVLGPPSLVSVGPDGFIRVGQMAQPTFPTPLQVTLSRPAQMDTDVMLASGDANSLAVPMKVTVLKGATTAPVPVSGLARTVGPVLITATALDGTMRTAGVRVIDVAEAATLKDLQPAVANIALNASVTMTVTLDLPAPPGGAAVTLASAPGGSVPPTVTIPQDQLSATFVYKQMGMAGTDTVTATFGAMKTAMITVKLHLVINELDYDQPSFDTLEFIEIYNPGSAADLTNLALVFVNGSNNTEYSRVKLQGMLGADSYLVVGTGTVMPDPNATFIKFGSAKDNIQNGDPDGVALVNTMTGQIIDSLSYGGSITMAAITGLMGARNLVEGVATPFKDTGANPGSLIRNPNGADTDDAKTDWVFTTVPTPGSANIKM